MTSEGEARFEFRVFGDRLDEVADRLRSLAEPGETRESSETYLVSTAAPDANPKVRDGLLDIKTLIAIREGCEQWSVRLKAEFPLDRELLETEVFPLLGLTPPSLERDEYTPAQLSTEVVDRHPDLTAVEVTKRRRLHSLEGCIAEIADVTIAGRRLQTVAVESADLDAVCRARRALGLDTHDNVSYPQAIKQAVGGRFVDR